LAFDGFGGVTFIAWGELGGEVVAVEHPVEEFNLSVVYKVVFRIFSEEGLEFGEEGFVFEDGVEEGTGRVHAAVGSP